MAKGKKKGGIEDLIEGLVGETGKGDRPATKTVVAGTLHIPGTLMLRNHVGSAENPETGVEYVMSTNFGDWRPIILSKKTGVSFSLSWSDLISIAVAAGIDEEWKE